MNKLFTITGSSSSGKTSIARALFSPESTIISYTSRKPRPGEVDGIDYYFSTAEEMLKMKENDEFIEFIEFDGNCYGYTGREVKDKLSKQDCVAVLTSEGLEAFLEFKELKERIVPVFLDASFEKINANLQKREDTIENKMRRLKKYEFERTKNLELASNLLNSITIDTDKCTTVQLLIETFKKIKENA